MNKYFIYDFVIKKIGNLGEQSTLLLSKALRATENTHTHTQTIIIYYSYYVILIKTVQI